MNASKKTSVLVADDDPRLLKLVQRNLELNGYRVLTAMDGTNSSSGSGMVSAPGSTRRAVAGANFPIRV